MSVKERLIEFVKYKGISNSEFCRRIGVSNAFISSMVKSIQPDKLKSITSSFPELNTGWLMTGEGEMLKDANTEYKSELQEKQFASHIEVKVVTTNARAGYSESYYADEYLQDMPTVLIEADREYKGKYLAFEINGDSMEPDYNAGDVVICREIKRDLWRSKLHINDWDFVIAHSTKGIMLKQITSHNVETGEIVCHSVNTEEHPDFTLNLREVAFLYNVVEHRISGKNKRRHR
jgi:transposase